MYSINLKGVHSVNAARHRLPSFEDWEQTLVLSSLQPVVAMMELCVLRNRPGMCAA